MNRNIIFIVTGIVVAVTMVLIFFYNENTVDKPKEDDVQIENLVTEGTAEDNPLTVPCSSEYEKYFASAEYITVSKVVRTIEERPDGEIFTTYEEYLVSDIDLVNGSDFTEDYTVAMKGSEFNEDKVKRGSFSEIFGFSYEDKNAWEIYEELLALNKVSGDWSEGIFDEATYEITKQRLYEFEANEELWSYMLEGLVYDEIIDKQVTYQVMETKDGLLYPDCFVATVVYSDAGWKVTKSMFLQVIVCK